MWKLGANLQDIAPELTPNEREIMISGVCGKCFDSITKEDDE